MEKFMSMKNESKVGEKHKGKILEQDELRKEKIGDG